jgi:hypothetical protein
VKHTVGYFQWHRYLLVIHSGIEQDRSQRFGGCSAPGHKEILKRNTVVRQLDGCHAADSEFHEMSMIGRMKMGRSQVGGMRGKLLRSVRATTKTRTEW